MSFIFSEELEKNYINFLQSCNIEPMPIEKAREIVAKEYAMAFDKSGCISFPDIDNRTAKRYYKCLFPKPHPQIK